MRKALVIPILILCGCSKSAVIEMPKTRAADTTEYIPIERNDTTEISGVPITFDVSVEGWEDTEIDNL